MTSVKRDDIQKAKDTAWMALFMADHHWAVPVLHDRAAGAYRLAADQYRKLASLLDTYADEEEWKSK